MYNPRKRVRDNDPEGTFIKRWVPELEAVPSNHLDRPERLPLHLQNELDVTIGETYPYPVVDYEQERQEVLETFGDLRAESEAAFSDPEVFRRASLSPKSQRMVEEALNEPSLATDDGNTQASASQAALSQFDK
ncbi:FAD-binding domain-containing protein [Halomicroarcula nitratireducens]|uniref:FAD-binding domain-containing protein n=1 Tax=Haloarcula nitratireducens TaxID=2487749 RepID=A0AAW4PIP9_9EURY|nr:FAD-binding domain-containing protein [Halomicroarcula nitratireducens]